MKKYSLKTISLVLTAAMCSNAFAQQVVQSGVPQPVVIGVNGQAQSVTMQQTPSVSNGQTQQSAQAPLSLPPSQTYSKDEVTAATQSILGLSPEEIVRIRKELDLRSKAASQLPGKTPQSVNSSVVAKLSPGSVAPVVRLSANRVTTVVIVDSNGQPWPVSNFSVAGAKDFFNVERFDKNSETGEGFMFTISPLTTYASGNLVLLLKGSNTPLTLELISGGQKEVDNRVDVRVQGFGPNTSPIVSRGLPNSVNSKLLTLLEGIPPENSKKLTTSNDNVDIWQGTNGKFYIRSTSATPILSPAWIGMQKSPDGTIAYEMNSTPSLLVMKENRVTQVNVSGF